LTKSVFWQKLGKTGYCLGRKGLSGEERWPRELLGGGDRRGLSIFEGFAESQLGEQDFICFAFEKAQ
jgi:hypothetical protein